MYVQTDIRTSATQQFIECTDRITAIIAESGVQEGLCTVYCSHTTAGLTVNENADPDVRRDMLHALDGLVPLRDPGYRHAEGNSAAHVKASMMGSSVSVPVVSGRLYLGTWQGIYLCEFDGPRQRQITVLVKR